MDALRMFKICCTIWTLIMLRTRVDSVQIKSPRAVFHLAREKYFIKQVGRPAELSKIGLHDMEQDANIIKGEKKLSDVNDELQVTKTSRRQADEGNDTVAFYVVLSASAIGLGNGQTIPFDQTIVDNKGFDPLFHAFVCPVNGVYMFRSALMSEANSHIETEVVKEGSPIFRMYSSGIKTNFHYDQGFNAGITNCEKGQRVWVRVNGNLGTSVRAEGFTTFSGYLLWKTPASVNSINVAFHTYLSRNINDLGKWNTIPFDQMLLNEHQGYDNITQHAFTCPVNGVYMFQSSIMSSFGVIEAEIVKDADPFVRVYASANGLSNDQHDQGFNAGIVRCNKNQKVWVRVSQGTSILQYLFSTFSGYLMWELEEASTIAGITGREINVNKTHVAFSSYLSNGATGLGKEQAIPFDMTPLNEGNRFDNGFYTFLCPVNGIYVFQSAVMVNVSHVETEIVKDRIPIARMYAGVNNQGGISHFDQGFNSGIVNCNHNERVWVRTGNQSSSTVDHRKTTTFSGFLLKKF